MRAFCLLLICFLLPAQTANGDRLATLLREASELQIREPRKGLDLAREAAELARGLDDQDRLVEARSLVASFNMDLGQLSEATREVEDLKALAKRLGHPRAMAFSLRAEGQLLEKQAQFESALQLLFEALRRFDGLNDEARVGETLGILGLVQWRMKRDDDAKESWERGREIFHRLGNAAREARLLNNLGVLAKNRKDFNQAQAYYAAAESIQTGLKNEKALSDLANNRAVLFNAMGDHASSEHFHRKALTIRERLGLKSLMADSCFNLAELFLTQRQVAKGKPFLVRCRTLAEEVQNKVVLVDLHRLESEYAAATGDPKGALESFRKYHEGQRALITEEANKKASDIRAAYELERQAKQIELLTKDQAVRKARLRMVVVGGISLGVMLILLAARYRLKVRTSQKIEAQNRDLDEVNHRLERANAFKSMFLASTSHELRTPVNAILGLSRLLQQGRRSEPERKTYIEAISQSAEALLHLLNDLLDAGKIEVGKLAVESLPMDLRQVLQEAHSLLAPRAEEKGLDYRLDLEEGLPPSLRGDPTRIRQIMLNLLSNALKFTTRGFVHCRANIRLREAGRVWIRLSVQDSGPGIPPEIQNRLFSAYAQADASTVRQFGGTGLGLYITRQLAQLMGGEAGLESQEGQGSTFWVDLPMELGEELAPAETDPVPEAVHGFQGRVLVADDNPANQMVTEALLRQEGLEVVAVENGLLALDALSQTPFDLVFLDGRMPFLDGPATVAEIQRLILEGLVTKCPLVALTGQVQPGDRERLLALGFDDYLGKPLQGAELKRVLNRFLVPSKVRTQTVVIEAPEGEEPETWNVLRQALGGDDVFVEFLQGFFEDGKTRIQRLSLALARDDRESISRDGHDLKSNAATLGFRDLSRFSWELEQEASKMSREELARQVTHVQAVFEELLRRWG